MADLSSLLCKLFEPDQTSVPDPSKRHLQAKRNQENFSVFLAYSIIYPFLMPLISFSTTTHFLNIFGTLSQAILYLILCRSYLWVFIIEYALVSTVGSILLMLNYEEVVFFHFGYAFIVPPIIFMMSQNIPLTSLVTVFQIVFFQTKYKYIVIHCLEQMGPSMFGEKLVGATTIALFHLFTFCFFALRLLQKKTMELFHAKKVVEDALEQQKTFILSFSHELRNPLNSLLGNLHLVLMGKISSEIKEMTKNAKICGELLLQYINNLLDTGKFEIGNLEVSHALTNVYDLFQRVWGISSEIIKRKNLVGNMKIDRKVPLHILIDPQRLTQVLLNLVGNAVKFTETGCISTTIQWLEYTSVSDECFEPVPYDETEEGLFEKEENVSMVSLSNRKRHFTSGYILLNNKNNKFNIDEVVHTEQDCSGILKIIVKDTGCGMKEDALKRLFQKFCQVSEDCTKRNIGSGLGLFITKEICKKMQGEIRVYSREKIGTTFIVCIPTVSTPVKKTYNDYPLDLIYRNLSIMNKKAIIADDSPFNVNLLCNYFSKLGVEVVATASNGQDCYKKYTECVLKEIDIDIITLDIDMPKINGKIACQKIRQYEKDYKLRKTNIVMISGNYDETDLNAYLDPNGYQQANHFFKKPLLFEDFMVKIYELLTKN